MWHNSALLCFVHRGPLKGSRGPLKGSRGPLKVSRGPFKGSRGPFKGPRGPLKGPRGGISGVGRCENPQENPGYLKAIWLVIFGPVFLLVFDEDDDDDDPFLEAHDDSKSPEYFGASFPASYRGGFRCRKQSGYPSCRLGQQRFYPLNISVRLSALSRACYFVCANSDGNRCAGCR